ncbi:hypothetical protein C8F01DRAFT_1175223 [Mycena amicta]|nr:hypothetical protein C8F01DRAFT_1175223 [Mycena amicta]
MGLEYPLTREFPWRYFTLISCVGAFVVVVFLATVNVALTAYETITVFKSDYNVTQTHWFHEYLPSLKPKPGTLCDSHVFNLGDAFTTNYTLFPYTVASIVKANAGDAGISYTGNVLDHCDVSSLYLTGNVNTFTIDYTAVITCRNDDYDFTARSDFSLSSLVGQYNTLMGAARSVQNKQSGTFNVSRDARGAVLDAVTSLSSNDIGSRIFSLAQFANASTSYPTIISLQADFPFCPASLGTRATCATSVPTFTIPASFFAYSNLTFKQYFLAQPPADDNQPSIYAALRIDLGNPSPNNFLLNTAAINSTLFATYPPIAGSPNVYSVSEEFAVLTGAVASAQYNVSYLLPLTLDGPATIDVVYLCRFQRPLAPAQAFIAVLVATLSMFGSGWALYRTLAMRVAVRHENGNACAAHVRDDSREKERFLSDSS